MASVNINMMAPIIVKNAPERKVFGAVLIPDEPDYDGDIVTAEKIETIHDLFNEKYQNIDVQHSLQNVGKIYTSYIAPSDVTFGEQLFPKGTWMMGVKVNDDAAWALVEKGILTGFSIMAINPIIGSAVKGKNGRTTLADLGNDWIVNAVSLVTNPAVPRAKFVSIKAAPEENILTKIINSLQGILHLITSTKSEDKILDVEVQDSIKEVIDVTPQEAQMMFEELMLPVIKQMTAIQEQLNPTIAVEAVEAVEADTEVEIETGLKSVEDKPEDKPADEVPTEDAVPAEDKPSDVPAEDNLDEKKEEVEKVADIPAEDTKPSAEDELQKKLDEALATIAELKTSQKSAYSKRLTGQDGTAAELVKQEAKPTRDSMGRKLK